MGTAASPKRCRVCGIFSPPETMVCECGQAFGAIAAEPGNATRDLFLGGALVLLGGVLYVGFFFLPHSVRETIGATAGLAALVAGVGGALLFVRGLRRRDERRWPG